MASSLPPARRIVSLLRSAGPLSPSQVMERLGLSQPTLYRAVKAQPEKAIALGARRNRKVAALRDLQGLGAETPVFMVDPEGDIHPVGRIFAFYPATYAFLPDNSPNAPRYYSVLPAFLTDSRPQGFLGDAFIRKNPDLGLAAASDSWSADDILAAMSRRGEDLPGNILIGTESFIRFQGLRAREPVIQSEATLTDAYLAAANAAAESSSVAIVGGTSPKFTDFIEGKRSPRAVVVKFSPAGDEPSAVRRRDILLCEWLALENLRDAGLPAVSARLHEAGGRVFLETERYDREGTHGRNRTLSFAALGALPPGTKESWASLGAQLVRARKISDEDQENIRRLECFSRMIGHSARRHGDLSFLWAPGESLAALAPACGIAPSLFQLDARGAAPPAALPLPLCDPGLLGSWKRALPIALNFWENVIEDPRISAGFREIAKRACDTLAALS